MNLLDVALVALALLGAVAYLLHLFRPRKQHSRSCPCAASGCKVAKAKISRSL